ncbi:hypothetical protein IWZ03DRAFT_226085 [Phyllosticta citriasiana]|uniref:F-box domain-containing protein n=1 Tax=Phyllosticta citriasiana TaxID=595635 RepID=A0ABR1KH99_9PEZI
MAHLATLFAQLPGPHARRDALDAILGDLTSYEWRDMTNKLLRRSFHCDVVGSLPVELVALIFQHLPPNAPFLYQTVSRRWRDVLSSSHVISSTLAQWYSDADPKLQGEIQGPLQDVYGTQLLKAEHAWRFQQNKPCCSRRYTCSSSRRSYRDYNAACVGDKICWLDNRESGRLLRLCNLRTGEMTAIAGEARESFLLCTLSRSIVAILAPRGFYVYDIAKHEKRYFLLPHTGSTNTMALTAGENTVAVGHYRHPRRVADVYLHDAHEQKTRHISVNAPAPPEAPEELSLTALLLNEDRRIFTAFFMALERGQNDEFTDYYGLYCVSCSFDGDQLHSDSAARLTDVNSEGPFLKTPWATDYTKRLYKFESYRNRRTILYFDNHGGHFSHQVVCEKFILQTPVFEWKGIRYRGACTRNDKCIDECSICKSHVPNGLDLESEDRFRLMFGDERFLVAFADEFCHVYCFDKHIKLPASIQPQRPLPLDVP